MSRESSVGVERMLSIVLLLIGTMGTAGLAWASWVSLTMIDMTTEIQLMKLKQEQLVIQTKAVVHVLQDNNMPVYINSLRPMTYMGEEYDGQDTRRCETGVIRVDVRERYRAFQSDSTCDGTDS